MVERFNDRLANALQTRWLNCALDVGQTLLRNVSLCEQSAMQGKTPIQAVKQGQESYTQNYSTNAHIIVRGFKSRLCRIR